MFNLESCLAFAGSQDGTVRLWDVHLGRCHRVWDIGTSVRHVQWNPSPQLNILAIAVYAY